MISSSEITTSPDSVTSNSLSTSSVTETSSYTTLSPNTKELSVSTSTSLSTILATEIANITQSTYNPIFKDTSLSNSDPVYIFTTGSIETLTEAISQQESTPDINLNSFITSKSSSTAQAYSSQYNSLLIKSLDQLISLFENYTGELNHCLRNCSNRGFCEINAEQKYI